MHLGIPAVVGLLAVAAAAADNNVSTSPETDTPPDWATNNALQMNLSAPNGQVDPIQYTVIPVIPNAGPNHSNNPSQTINITGAMIATDVSNFNKVKNPNDVAYLSCDNPSSDSLISVDEILNDLIAQGPKAIVLYSLASTWCSLDFGTPPSFSNILSMADSGEAQGVLNSLNGTATGRLVNVSITGNASSNDPGDPSPGGNNSTVAMVILYTITALIAILFLVIIVTGVVRAQRHPERYGPRRALGNRPRQSRARGLAMAVLETLPIVKFKNNQDSAKPDPDLELDAATTGDGRTQRSSSIFTNDPRHEASRGTTGATGAAGQNEARDAPPAAESRGAADAAPPVENAGCSICTEDFREGEDMRVLPCNHKFHPTCIDPWLVNVSGTCPLCRLDLHEAAVGAEDAAIDRTVYNRNSTLPPPLALEGEDDEGSHGHHRNRLSRLFDINRLRQATQAEQMAALRQMRTTRQGESGAQESSNHDTERERGQRAHLTAKLKEKFRIRTRARSPERHSDDDS
ncbi:hypothetical protein HDV57DRAFT_513773 [Trichoderma longibrachiatum]